jgi:hypothetical protein
VTSEPDDESTEEDADDEFDRMVGAMIETDLVHNGADELLATGSLTITRPGGTVTASLTLPRWPRQGALRTSVSAQDGSHASDGHVPLGRRRLPPGYLRGEVELQLAVALAGLELGPG